MTSFHMHFEKVGRGLLREEERREGEWAVLVEARGDEKRKFIKQRVRNRLCCVCFLLLTELLCSPQFFGTDTLSLSSLARVDSAKKHHEYYLDK